LFDILKENTARIEKLKKNVSFYNILVTYQIPLNKKSVKKFRTPQTSWEILLERLYGTT
jgi:hypothetical protein